MLVKMVIKVYTVFLKPHSFTLSIRAVGGKRRKTCLRRSRVFYVPTTARSASHPPKADVKDGCLFLAPSFRQVKEGGYKKLFNLLRSFLCLPKETNQRKGSLSLGQPITGFPFLNEIFWASAETHPLKADSDSPRRISTKLHQQRAA